MHLGITCFDCRKQYADAGRSHDVPCDVSVCKYVPSPGDTSEKGCGLLPENETALYLYPRWKRFGEAIWTFVDMDISPHEAETLVEKLMLIDEYSPKINESQNKRKK